jgi:beta-phosphoglucomutase-like phosphatase (HAD superfamily)
VGPVTYIAIFDVDGTLVDTPMRGPETALARLDGWQGLLIRDR